MKIEVVSFHVTGAQQYELKVAAGSPGSPVLPQ